jgi:hypothetical protein
MAFSDDHGGFAFSCDDAKMSFNASTWSTHLSQLARVAGPVYIMTGLLPDIGYISKIIGKRPRDIFIIANVAAETQAKKLKSDFPQIRIVLHNRNNAKLVLVSPGTVWLSSADFGKTELDEVGVGLHSQTVFEKTLSSLFHKAWAHSREVI